MRGLQVKELAHHSNIELSYDVPEPKAKEGEILIDVYSGGLNFFDVSFHIICSIRPITKVAPDPPNSREIPDQAAASLRPGHRIRREGSAELTHSPRLSIQTWRPCLWCWAGCLR